MEGLGSLLFFAIIFFLLMRFGCGAHMFHGHGNHENHNKPQKKSKEGKYIDPVCDMEVEEEQAYSMMFEGEPYHFCTRSCLNKFDEEPGRYLHKKDGEEHGM